jgi:TPR repeat protein
MKWSPFAVVAVWFVGVVAGVWGQSVPDWTPVAKWSSSSVICLDAQARAELATQANKGDPDAQDKLGTQYFSGCPGSDDPAKGITLIKQAAHGGNAHAQLMLGDAYQSGRRVTRDKKAAVYWFEKSAQQRNARAQNNLGVLYQEGNDEVAKDEKRAVKLFLAAAEDDVPEAAYNLATMFDQGRGVDQDFSSARKWYQRAAERKDADSEYRLAMLLAEGLGGEKDQAAATRWFRRAAEDGSLDAQYKLGQLTRSNMNAVGSGYFQFEAARAMAEGRGMEKNLPMAIKLLEKSAEAGYPPAFLALGRIYARGDGVAKDETKAQGYYEQAIAHDSEFAMAYNSLAWMLVTSQDPKIRNPKKASEYASRAIELSGGKEAYQLDSLAHAYFELGEIEKAVETEGKAVALEPKNDVYDKTLADFKNAKVSPAGPK